MFAFRPEAVAHRMGPPLADAVHWLPSWSRWSVWLIGLVLLAGATAVAHAPLRERLRVGGQVVAPGGSTQVYPAVAAVVSRVLVAEGQQVAAGQVLLELERVRALAPGVSELALLELQLERQRGSLEQAERSGAGVHEARGAGLAARAEQLQGARRLLRRELVLAQAQLATLRGQQADRQRLAAAGAIARVEVERARGERRAQQRQVLALRRELAGIDQSLAGNAAERAALVAQWRREQSQLELEGARVAAELTRLRADARFAVTAPVAGTVSALEARPGRRVSPEAPLLTLEPEHSRHEVELLLPSAAAGRAAPGMRVRLHYSAFPHRRYGSVAGHILRITETPVSVHDPSGSNVPVYRARVAVEDARIREWPVRTGMTVDAVLLLEARAVWRWVLDPVSAFVREAA